MSHNPSQLDVIKSLLTGVSKFVFVYSLTVLSPLILVRLLGIEEKGSQHDFAIASGMVALMIILTVFFFSGRFERLNGVRGMDLMLKFHRRVVFFALILIVAHVVLVVSKSMPKELWVVGVAFLLIIITIILSKNKSRIKITYEAWRLLHGLIAISIVCLVVYHALAEGHYSENSVVRYFWLSATMFTILTLPYVHVYLPYKARKNPYKIISIEEEANKQWTVEIDPKFSSSMKFYSGQYAFVEFCSLGRKASSNPFSISSSPETLPKLTFTIKEVGDFTKKISDLKLGSDVFVSGPYGYMTRESYRGPENKGRGIVLLAAGIGITPMISILRDIKTKNNNESVKLFYSCRFEEDLLFVEELKGMIEEIDLDLHLILSRPNNGWAGETGRIDSTYLNENINFPEFNQYLYFVCGTTDFVSNTVDVLDSMKDIPVYNIRYEDFSVYT